MLVNQNSNLPQQVTSFIGRDTDIAEISKLLVNPDCRLLTLVGLGGIGKTRLALEVATNLESEFIDGCYYAAFAPLTHVSDILSVVIHSLSLVVSNSETALEQLLEYLSHRNLLLIIDNFEHLLDGSTLMVDILREAPDVKILVTSRQELNLQEEWVRRLTGLTYPESSETNPDTSYDALNLFFERAHQVQGSYSEQELYNHAVRICQIVDGMPLAIELAVSWLRVLTPSEIEHEIQCTIDFLETNFRNFPERHRSIQAVFEQSFHLCSTKEQEVFKRLCVFRGGFTRAAAERVTGANLHSLSGLVEKSMIRKLPDGRYDMQKLLQQYACEKLRETHDFGEAQQAHTNYFTNFVLDRTPDIKGRRQLEGLNEIEADFENIRTVWYHAIETHQLEMLDCMAEGLTLYCDMRARYQDARKMLADALSVLSTDDNSEAMRYMNRLRARWIQVSLLFESSIKDDVLKHIQSEMQSCIEVAEHMEDTVTVALIQWLQGESWRVQVWPHGAPASVGFEALPFYEQSAERFQQLGDKYYLGRILRGKAFVYRNDDTHIDLAYQINQQHLEITRNSGDYSGFGHAVLYQNVLLDDAESRSCVEQAFAIWQEMGDRKSVGVLLCLTSRDAFLAGDIDHALELIQQGYHLMEKTGLLYDWMPVQRAVVLQFAKNEPSNHKVTRVMADALQCEHLASYGGLIVKCLANVLLARQNSALTKHVRTALYDARRSNEPIVMAACLAITAVYLAENGRTQRAIQLLGLVSTHKDASRLGWVYTWDYLLQLQNQLRHDMGEELYHSLWNLGTTLDLYETIDELLLEFAPSDSSLNEPSLDLIESLTAKEVEVLELLADGLSNSDIADRLTIAPVTVRSHSYNCRQKLGASNNRQMINLAKQHGII